MTKNALTDLLAQKAALEKQIADVQREQRSDAVGKVKALMAEYGLTLADLTAKPAPAKPAAAAGAKVAPKYRNSATGETWTGRGRMPVWMKTLVEKGAKREKFLIK